MREVVVYFPMRVLPWSVLSANGQPAKHPIHTYSDGVLMAIGEDSPQGFIPVYGTWDEVRQIFGPGVQVGHFTMAQADSESCNESHRNNACDGKPS